jgi:hypothetical protein
MKAMPWQDIYTEKQWDDLLNQYRRGKIGSKAKTFKHHIGRIFSLKHTFALPHEVISLTQQIQFYDQIEKRSIENLKTRAGLLRAMVNTGELFMARHKIPVKGVQKASLEGEQYKAYKKTLDYAVSKLVRRARRKADYIEKLMVHQQNADRGFTGGKEGLLEYIKSKTYSPDDEDLVRMGPNVALEKIDPWHRNYEATFNVKSMKLNAPSGSSIFAVAFNQWIDDKQHGDIPFFIWMEGHYVCTNVTDKRLISTLSGEIAYEEPKGRVAYFRSDQKIPVHLPFIAAQNGLLWAYRMGQDGAIDDVDFFDTSYTQADFPDDYLDMAKGKFRAHAYVWSRDGFIFAGPHIGRKFHHSSFVSGKKVRCAGMITVTSGKVTRVDNDSGHYKPGTRHLRNFVQYLSTQNALTQDAMVEDVSVKPSIRVSATSFLAGDLKVKAERDLQRLNGGLTTLLKLVEERFQEMKADIGPAPEHLLWTRAYKAVCLDLGEFDAKWKTRANAPPIPRTRAKASG